MELCWRRKKCRIDCYFSTSIFGRFHRSLFSPLFESLMVLTSAGSRQPWWRQHIYSLIMPREISPQLMTVSYLLIKVRASSFVFPCTIFLCILHAMQRFPPTSYTRWRSSTVKKTRKNPVRKVKPVRRAGATAREQLGKCNLISLVAPLPSSIFIKQDGQEKERLKEFLPWQPLEGR